MAMRKVAVSRLQVIRLKPSARVERFLRESLR
jgi:hypothetical protein